MDVYHHIQFGDYYAGREKQRRNALLYYKYVLDKGTQ
jgi:hypothetical protein